MTETVKPKLEFRGGWGMSLVPVAIFLFFCILYFVIFQAFEMYALAMGSFVALLIGSLLVQKGQYERFWDAVYDGARESIPILVLLLIIGMFSALVKATGLSTGFVWLAQQAGVSGGIFTAFTFFAVCVVAAATGSSLGTMFISFPIFYAAGLQLGCDPAMLAGAIVGGGIFGDNVAPISDTTIISASTQEYTKKDGFADIGGCVKSRSRYALCAAAISFVLYWIFGGGAVMGTGGEEILAASASPTSLWMLIPVVVMLTVAIITRNIYKAIIAGLLLGSVVGLATGLITFENIIGVKDGAPVGFLTDGVNGMIATAILVLSVYGIMGELNAAGALEKFTSGILNSKLGNSVQGAEACMLGGITVTTMLFGGVTSASMATFGKIQNEVGKRVGLHPYRRANLLDCGANSLALVVPFLSVFALIGSMLSGGYDVAQLSIVAVAGCTFYCMALFVMLVISIITGWGRRFEGENGEPVKEPPTK
ncbi:MAG: hypothetical protein IKE43_04735 [Coriobacteriales bacterium]|nr:hypothetical protein [Coriobacteriales bacterium]